MNTIKVITEAYCEICHELWGRSYVNPAREARKHADRTKHRVRITRVVVTILNQNGKEKVTK